LARKVIVKQYDCNFCARRGCRGDVIRDGKGGIKQHLRCSGQVLPNDKNVTLLQCAAEHDGFATVLGTILQTMDLQFEEVGRYPYFRFVYRESQQEVHTF
jgi:hypothetical protein